MGFPPVEGTYLAEWLAAGLLILFAFAMALFDLPGNTVMVLSGLGFAFYDPAKYFDIRLISAMILVYAMGEIWEFALSFFGIKKKVKNISWWAVLFIGCGTFVGTLLGSQFPCGRQCAWRRYRGFCGSVSVRIYAVPQCAECGGSGLAGGKNAVHGYVGQTGGYVCPGDFAGQTDFLLSLN